MLGEIIGEMKGNVSGQRVTDVEGPTIETSISASGSLRGVQVTELLTYIANPSSNRMLHGIGNGIIRTLDGEITTYTGEGIGRFNSSGVLNGEEQYFFRLRRANWNPSIM
ncbi:MAG: hypothetical protein WB501_05400 [Nitrososphaeraceae archaeon]